jgi:hypothetical protein
MGGLALVIALIVHYGPAGAIPTESQLGSTVLALTLAIAGMVGLCLVRWGKPPERSYPQVSIVAIFVCALAFLGWYRASQSYIHQIIRACYVIHSQPLDKGLPEKH